MLHMMLGVNADTVTDERDIRIRPTTSLFVAFEKIKLDIGGVCSEAKFVDWLTS